MLNVDFNGIGADGAKALALALEKNTTLRTLNVGWNHQIAVGGGAQALAKALEKNSTLTTLELFGNEIGNKGIDALLKALDYNYTLLNLEMNGINEEQQKLLFSLLKRNHVYRDKEERVKSSLLTTETYKEAKDIDILYRNNHSVFFALEDNYNYDLIKKNNDPLRKNN
jgi:exopolyphosphatase/pppGpp-phosphohydrolase